MKFAYVVSLLTFMLAAVKAQPATAACVTAAPEEVADNGGIIALQVIGAVVLTLSAGLFSGLTLGLMSLESMELELLIKAGDERQAKYAKRIQPVRQAGNRLLCTLVLTNTAIYTLLPIVVSNLTSGLAGFLISTILSVLFGEIIPQSICARHGLAIGAHTVWLVKILMILLFPLAWPIAKLLDLMLGKEIAEAYSRKELTELIAFHAMDHMDESSAGGDLNKDETTIIRNALHFSLTAVNEIMTPLPKVFMLPIDGVLDDRTMVRIGKAGYSRVPVVDGARGNIVGLLIIKTLFLLSPEARIPIRTVLEVTKHKSVYVEYGTSLDVMLNMFQWGKSHLAVVRRLRTDCTDEQLAAANKPLLSKVSAPQSPAVRRTPLLVPKASSAADDNDDDDDDDDDDDADNNNKKKSDAPAKKPKKRVRIKTKRKKRRVVADDDSSESSESSDESDSEDSDDAVVLAEKAKTHDDAIKKAASKDATQQGLASASLQNKLQADQYVTVGVVTLEDVVEELIGEEIYDETDFDEEGSVASAAAGRDAVDKMMTMAFAAMKWRQIAGLNDNSDKLRNNTSTNNNNNNERRASTPLRRRHASMSSLPVRSHTTGDNAFKSNKVTAKTLLKKTASTPKK